MLHLYFVVKTIMAKEFFITGRCFPKQHYMADVSKKLEQILRMVENGSYFIINRPRQYGKTTMLYSLAEVLRAKGDYIVLNTSFEGIGDVIFDSEENFSAGFIRLMERYSKIHSPELLSWFKNKAKKVKDLETLSDMITDFNKQTDKRVVLMIDEVDKSSNNQLFVSFLAMLRNKYLERDDDKTFHAIVLAGVHDVKSLKLKLRPEDERKYNSPWNIAADFTVDMNLQPEEIKPMLDEYVSDKSVKMDTQRIADQLFYYTSGYPFLVSKLCKMLDENYLPKKEIKEWTDEDLERAVQALVNENNTNFESLIKNIENNSELYELVYAIAVDGESFPFNIHNATINLGILYGIFTNREGVKIQNRIYNEVLLNYMSVKVLQTHISKSDVGIGYKNDDGTLNMEAVLLGFQTFMKKEYSKKDRDFLEKNGRLVFLAFIKPIINGSGHDFKETQISEEKRLDVVITHLQHKYIAEIKLWRGEKAHQKGLLQLSNYLDVQDLKEGYLLIFDHSEVKKWHSEWIDIDGKKVFMVWV
jgi:hypothetical protein